MGIIGNFDNVNSVEPHLLKTCYITIEADELKRNTTVNWQYKYILFTALFACVELFFWFSTAINEIW